VITRRDFMGTQRDEFDEVEEPIEEPAEEFERIEQARLRAKEAAELP
jgi:hypothetical protein